MSIAPITRKKRELGMAKLHYCEPEWPSVLACRRAAYASFYQWDERPQRPTQSRKQRQRQIYGPPKVFGCPRRARLDKGEVKSVGRPHACSGALPPMVLACASVFAPARTCKHPSAVYRCMVHRSSASSNSGRSANACRAWVYVNQFLDRLCISGHWASCFSTVASKN